MAKQIPFQIGSLLTINDPVYNGGGGNFVQGVARPFNFANVAAGCLNRIIPANSTMTMRIQKVGSGVIVPAGRILLDIEDA